MAKKNIGATLSIKDGGFTAGISKASAGATKFKGSLTNATGGLKTFATHSANTCGSLITLAKRVAGVVVAFAGINAIVNFGKESVTAAGVATLANVKLETVMKNLKGTTDAQIESVKKASTALMDYTTIDDEAAKSGAAQLAVFGLKASTINSLLPSMADMAVGLNGINVGESELQQTGLMLGKAMSGVTTTMRKAGIILTKNQESILKTGTESKKAAVLVDVLKKKFGGLAKNMGDTPEGRILRFKNAWMEVKEEVGDALMPAVTKVFGLIIQKLPVIQGAITKAINSIKPVVSKIIEYVTKNLPTIQAMMSKAIEVVKPPLLWLINTAIPKLCGILANVGTVGVDIFDKIKVKVIENMPKFESLKEIGIDIGNKLKEAWEKSQPTLNWLKDVLLPSFVDALGVVATHIKEIYDYFKDNWSQIGPIVDKVTKAILIYKAALMITSTWSKILKWSTVGYTSVLLICKAATQGVMGVEVMWAIWRSRQIAQNVILTGMLWAEAAGKLWHAGCTWIQVAATQALTGVQWALNAAFIASPIGWIVLGVAALIAVFVLLWKNNKGFRDFFINMWEGIKVAVKAGGDMVKGVINIIIDAINGLIGLYIGGINTLIKGVNFVSGALKIPAIPLIPVPAIPKLAEGGNVQRYGRVLVGEKGPEFLDLPEGARVTPLKKGDKTGHIINIHINGTSLTVEEILSALVPKLKLALDNM